MNSTPATEVADVATGTDNVTIMVPESTNVGLQVQGDPSPNKDIPLTDVFQRDTLLLRQTIDSLDTPLINLVGLFDLYGEYLSNPLIASYLTNYSLCRFDMVITVRLVVPGSCYGLYNVQLLCDGGEPTSTAAEGDGPSFDSPYTSVGDLFALLNCELKNSAVIDIPFEHYQDMISTREATPRCWRLLVWAFSPLSSTINDFVSGEIQVYGRMAPGYKLTNLRFQMGKKKKKSTAEQFPVREAASSGGKWSTFGTKMASGLGTLGAAIPAIAPFAEPAAAGLAAISSVASMFGFTRDASPEKPMPTVRRVFSTFGNVDNLDSGEISALSVTNATSIDPRLGGGDGEDPMSFPSLFERWGLVDTFTISTTTPVSVVRQIPVTPFISAQTLGVTYLTPGGYAGMPFRFWRGGMEFMIYIPSSPNLEGTLQVFWDSLGSSSDWNPLTVDPTNILPNVSVNMNGTSATQIQVGYSQAPGSCPKAVQTGLPITTSITASGSVNGKLVFRVMSPLTAPKVTSATVRVLVFARPMQDMRFGVPANKGLTESFDQIHFQMGPRLEWQMDRDNLEMSSQVVLQESDSYPSKEMLFGEEFMSARALWQHFCSYADMSGVTLGSFPHFPPVARASSSIDVWNNCTPVRPGYAPMTYYAYYSQLYTGLRGSTRYKLVGGTTAVNWYIGVFDPEPTSYGVHTDAMDVQTATRENGVEVTVPYYHKNKYLLAREYPIVYLSPGLRLDSLWPNVNPPGGTTLFVAAGSDTTVTRFRRVPGIIRSAI
jgi:hypothetical protein